MTRMQNLLAVLLAVLAVLAPVAATAHPSAGSLDGDAASLCGGGSGAGAARDATEHPPTHTTRTTEPGTARETTSWKRSTSKTTRKTTARPTRKPPARGTTTSTCPDGRDVTVEGEPELRAFAPNNTVEPGERTRLVVQLSNSGTVDDGGLDVPPEAERLVTTARNVRVTLRDGDAPVEVRTATTPLGDLPSGSIAQAGFDIDVDEDAEPGVYEVPVRVSYEYTESVSGDDRDEERERETFYVKLVVTENARFEVVDVDEDLQVGETGTVEVTLENVGEADLRDATVTVRSRNGDLLLGGGRNATRFVGRWDAGEERTVEVEATATNGSAPQRYALSAVVEYTDPDGRPGRSLPRSFGVRLDDEQSFSLDDLEGDLRVGADGTVTGTVTNEGPEPVADAVVRLVDGDGDVVAQRSTFVLGDLDEDESEDFSLPVRVPASAKPGERRLRFVVEYLTRDGDPRTSDPLFDTLDVRAERDGFGVEDVDEDLQVGETGTVEVTLENRLDEDLTDATVTVSSPNADLVLGDGGNATRFVGRWDAGDEETVAVRVRATNGSAPQSYPLELTVSYTDEDGDARRSESVLVAVTPDAEQAFAVRNVTSTLRVGEEGRLNGTVVNLGPRDVPAAVVVLSGTGDNLRPRETEAVLGAVDEGENATFSLPVSVLETAQPGPRRVLVAVEYVTEEGDVRRSDPIPVVVDVASETERFALRDVDADLQADDTGTVVLTLRNRWNETLTDATVSLVSESRGLELVGSGVNDTRFVGTWRPGETRTVRYRVEAANETGNQTYAFRASVAYEGDEGQTRRSGALLFGAEPAVEQAFAVGTVESTLRVGEEGRVLASVTNRGPGNVSVVGVELLSEGGNVNPVETEAAVGDLPAGATAEFSLPVEISESADAGSRQFTYRVHYTDDGDRRTSDVLVADVRVAPARDPFLVDGLDVTVVAGESEALTLEITNNRGARVTNVRAKAFADSPLSVTDGDAFVDALAPNETATVRFTVSAAADAGEKTYAISVDFLYTTPDGDDALSKPVTVGVTVERPPPEGLPWWLLPVLVALLVALVVAWVLRRRRQRGSETARDVGEDDGDGSGDAGERGDAVTSGGRGERGEAAGGDTERGGGTGVDDHSGSDASRG